MFLGVESEWEAHDAQSFTDLRRYQAGAFTRGQAAAYGITDKVLWRGVRARRLQRIHPGVYVDFTGPLPWETRVWAALLAASQVAAALQLRGWRGTPRPCSPSCPFTL